MLKFFFSFFYKLLVIFDKITKKLLKKNFLLSIKELIEIDCYKKIKILDQNINFFLPNKLIEWRVDTFYINEPETLEWINSFKNDEKIIFWDIGANIGLYSIYNALKNKNSTTISFEPSSSNLRTLTRNIYINNLQDKIKIFTLPLSEKENSFLLMKEGDFKEGGALNSFGSDKNFEGKSFDSKMDYNLFGTSINFLLEKNLLEIPDYIKIDVDGIEHLILKGSKKFLQDKKIKSLSIEINENFAEQHREVLNIMSESNFKFLHKKQNENLSINTKFSKTFNYVFEKQ
tara:strand:+ start:2465 stop:3328 length:864 start_codon:yes stop_codon:yes gene_type:complete